MSIPRVVIPALAVIAAFLALAGCAPKEAALRPLAAPSPAEGMVVYVAGGVQLSRDATWLDAEPGDTVGAGTVLKTGTDGYCELKFGDAISVRVEPDTEFRCERVAVAALADVGARVTAGDILVKVKQLSGSSLSIDTPSAVLGVRGTAFKVSVSGTATRVTVREGMVAVGRAGATLENLTVGQRLDTDLGADLAVQPAYPADLDAIDAFVPSVVRSADAARLVKIVVVVEPADAEIVLDGVVVGRGTWGAVLEEGTALTLVVRREGYEEDVVFVPRKGQRTARIERKLKAKPPVAAPPDSSDAPAPSASTASAAEPAAEPAPTTPVAMQPTDERPVSDSEPAPVKGPTFRVEAAIADDRFFQWAAQRFARQVPGFALVATSRAASRDASAWPRGADLAGGPDPSRDLTYERLPQLVAAKLVRPLDGWFEWTQVVPALVDAVRVNGRVYGIPLGGASPLLFYNRDLVREPPASWAQIVSLSASLAPRGIAALAAATGSAFHMGMFPESRDVRLLVPDTAETRLGTAVAARVFDELRDALRSSGVPAGLPPHEATTEFSNRRAALLIEGPWAFPALSAALGDSLGVAVLPTWGSPPKELAPYANVLALFVSSAVSDERIAVLKRFTAFLLGEEAQAELAVIRLKQGNPTAPALRRLSAGSLVDQEPVISVLHRQLQTAVPMPRGPVAADAWQAYQDVLEGIRRQDGGEELRHMAEARFFLYGLQRREVPAGVRELRAVMDAPEKNQGLYFRAWDEESDLRLVEVGDGRGVVSVNELGRYDDGAHFMLYLVVSHAPFRGGKAPALKGRIEYFDEPNASLRIKYDSKDRSVRENPDAPDTWGAWKEAAFISCTGTRTWKTADFPLPDAMFNGRCNGADLRIEVAARGKVPAVRTVILAPGK